MSFRRGHECLRFLLLQSLWPSISSMFCEFLLLQFIHFTLSRPSKMAVLWQKTILPWIWTMNVPNTCCRPMSSGRTSKLNLYADTIFDRSIIFVMGNFSREYSMSMYWSSLTITTCGQQPYPSTSAQNMLEVVDTLIGKPFLFSRKLKSRSVSVCYNHRKCWWGCLLDEPVLKRLSVTNGCYQVLHEVQVVSVIKCWSTASTTLFSAYAMP